MATLLVAKRAFPLVRRPLLPVKQNFVLARGLSLSGYRNSDEGLFSKMFGLGSVEKATG